MSKNTTTRIAALLAEIAEGQKAIDARLTALEVDATKPATKRVTKAAPATKAASKPASKKAAKTGESKSLPMAQLRACLKQHKADGAIKAGVTAKDALAEGLMLADGTLPGDAKPVTAKPASKTASKPASKKAPAKKARTKKAPAPTKGSMTVKKAGGTLTKREWNDTVVTKARFAGKPGKGNVSVLRVVQASWAEVVEMRDAGETPDAVVTGFTAYASGLKRKQVAALDTPKGKHSA